MVNFLRRHVGKQIYYIGFRILPANMRRGIACMSALGLCWATANEDQLLKVMSGEISIDWEWTAPPSTPEESAGE